MTGSLVYRGGAVFLPHEEALVVADLHLGRSRTAAFEYPLDAGVKVIDRLLELVDHFEASSLIVAGDCLDAFGVIPPGVTDRFRNLQEKLARRDAEFLPIRGNHDTMLDSLLDDEPPEARTIGDTIICHGHAMPDELGDRYILGHEHPALRIEGAKEPCYLLGEQAFDGSDVLVLPAFSPLVRGTTFNTYTSDDCHTPILHHTTLERYRPILVADPSLEFPALGELRAHL